MSLHKALSTLTIAVICVLPLAVTTGCTGPLRGTSNNTNTSQSNQLGNTSFSDYDSNTTN